MRATSVILTLVLIVTASCRTGVRDVQLKEVGGGPSVSSSVAPLFEGDDIISLELEAPFHRLFEAGDAPVEPKVTGRLRMASNMATDESWLAVDIRLRGATSLVECSFPKIKVKITSPVQGTIFSDIKSFKIGTHCRDDDSDLLTRLGRLANEKAPVREGLVYKFMEILQVPVVKSRIVRITYRDTENGDESTKKALLLEDIDKAAKRFGGEELEYQLESEIAHDFEPTIGLPALARVYLAESLVGNWDWTLRVKPAKNHETRLHNIKIIRRPDGSEVASPYDFDMASTVSGKPRISGNEQNSLFFRDKPLLFRYLALEMQRARTEFDQAVLDGELAHFAAKRPALEAAIAASIVDTEGKTNFMEHVASFFEAAQPDKFYLPMTNTDIVEVFADESATKLTCHLLRRGTPLRILEEQMQMTRVEVWGLGCSNPIGWVKKEFITR